MVLLLIIVKEEDKDEVRSALNALGHQATMIATTGEFLQYGNTTFLLGIEESQLEHIINCLEKHTSVRFMEHTNHDSTKLHRAVVFVLKIDQFVKIPPRKIERKEP